MIIFAIHIITEDGRTSLSEYYQNPEDLPDVVLFGGFNFYAINSFGVIDFRRSKNPRNCKREFKKSKNYEKKFTSTQKTRLY